MAERQGRRNGRRAAVVLKSTYKNKVSSDTQEFKIPTLRQIYPQESSCSSYPAELFTEISNYLAIVIATQEKCLVCIHLFKCSQYCYKDDVISVKDWIPPDPSILDSITADDLDNFAAGLEPKPIEPKLNEDKVYDITNMSDVEFSDAEFSLLDKSNKNIMLKSFKYETPKSFAGILSKLDLSDCGANETNIKRPAGGAIATKSPPKQLNLSHNLETDTEILTFFKLNDVQDIFTDVANISMDSDATIICTSITEVKPASIEKHFCPSPDLFEDYSPVMNTIKEKSQPKSKSFDGDDENFASPVLSSYDRAYKLKMNVKKQLFDKTNTSKNSGSLPISKPNLANLSLRRKSLCHAEETAAEETATVIAHKKAPITPNKSIDLDDICDLSTFGLPDKTTVKLQTESFRNTPLEELDISDICNLTAFGIASDVRKTESQPVDRNKENDGLALNITDICDISGLLGSLDSPLKKSESSDLTGNTNRKRNWSQASPLRSLDTKSKRISDPATPVSTSSTSISTHSKLSKPDQKSPLDDMDLDDFCDFSNLIGDVNKILDQTENVIDLTSSTENSPVKNKSQQVRNKKLTGTNLVGTSPKNLLTLKKQDKRQLKKAALTPKTPKRQFNLNISYNSDDEFEEKTPIRVKTKKPTPSTSGAATATTRTKPTIKTKRKKLLSDFIEDEAALSEDENVFVSQDEICDEPDEYEASFVADDTEDFIHNTQVHVNYLKSVKSPVLGRGKFKIPEKPRYNITNVYSQQVDGDNTYMNDSFCVNTEVNDGDDGELSELEILENKLEAMKRKKRKDNEGNNKRRRRIVVMDDDSD